MNRQRRSEPQSIEVVPVVGAQEHRVRLPRSEWLGIGALDATTEIGEEAADTYEIE
jgi:hypothetical protein